MRVQQAGVLDVVYFACGKVYLHGDPLRVGSASLTTDASGNSTGQLRYKPYGETRYREASRSVAEGHLGHNTDRSPLHGSAIGGVVARLAV